MGWFEKYDRGEYRGRTKEEFIQILKESLLRPQEIIKLRWISLNEVAGFNFCHQVYHGGWDFSEDTKKARQILTHMCFPLKGAFKAEDWL